VSHVVRMAPRGDVYKMSVQFLETDGKAAFAVLPSDEYRALLELAEDARDAEALRRAVRRIAAGEEETIPVEVVDRLLSGEPPVRVWREFQGLTATTLAEMVEVTPAHISKLETGKGEPSVSLLRRLSVALDADLESLIGPGQD